MRRQLMNTIELPPSHDDLPLYDQEFLESLEAMEGDGNKKLESVSMRWVNQVSRRATDYTETETGTGLDTFLPPYREAFDIDVLKAGDHICRAVACLLFEHKEAVELSLKAGHTIKNLSNTTKVDSDDLLEFLEAVKNVRYGKTKQADLFRLAIGRAATVLGLSNYSTQALTAGGSSLLITLLAHLMLVSPPVREPSAMKLSARLAADYELVRQQLDNGLRERASIKNLHEYFGQLSLQRAVQKKEEEERAAAKKAAKLASPDPKDDDVVPLVAVEGEKKEEGENAEEKKEESEDAEEKREEGEDAEEKKEEGEDAEEKKEEGEEEDDPEDKLPKPEVNELLVPPDVISPESYQKLSMLIDAYLRNGQEQKMMHESMTKLEGGLSRSRELRIEIEEDRDHRDGGVRLATEARRFVQSKALEGPLSEAGWI
jgi:hypothetical protein